MHRAPGPAFGFRISGVAFRVLGDSGFRDENAGLRVSSLSLRDKGSKFRVRFGTSRARTTCFVVKRFEFRL